MSLRLFFALALGTVGTALCELPSGLPTEFNTSLWYPYNGISKIGNDSYPVYTSDQESEDCPKSLEFQCSKCLHGCDFAKNDTDFRPCRNPDKAKGALSTACYPIPLQPGEATEAKAFGNISRRGILERGLGWLASSYEYKWPHTPLNSTIRPESTLESCGSDDDVASCPRFRYSLDCDGFVKMSWSMPNHHPIFSVCEGSKRDVGHPIHCGDLQPGDAICHSNSEGKIVHIQLFRQWLQKPNWVLWQMGGEFGKVNEIHGSYNGNTPLKCIRRNSLV